MFWPGLSFHQWLCPHESVVQFGFLVLSLGNFLSLNFRIQLYHSFYQYSGTCIHWECVAWTCTHLAFLPCAVPAVWISICFCIYYLYLFFSIYPNLLLWSQVVHIKSFFPLFLCIPFIHYKSFIIHLFLNKYLNIYYSKLLEDTLFAKYAAMTWSADVVTFRASTPVTLITFLRAHCPQIMPHCFCSICA